jgi:aspartate kinase
MLVFKFGGASVKDANAVKNVAAIVQLFLQQKIVIVLSAMGKTTNALETLVMAYRQNMPNAHQLLNTLKEYHFEICKQLFENEILINAN